MRQRETTEGPREKDIERQGGRERQRETEEDRERESVRSGLGGA